VSKIFQAKLLFEAKVPCVSLY